MSQHDTLTQALQDAASSLETISRLAGKAAHPNGDETCMGTFPEVRGYATSRAAVARAALSATQPAQAAQSVPGVNKAVQLIPGMTKEQFAYVNHCALEVDAAKAETARLLAENAALKAQAAQGEPAEHWHRLYLEKCQQYNDRVAQLGGVIEGLEAEAAQGAGEVVALPIFDDLDDEAIDVACTAGSIYRVDFMRAYTALRDWCPHYTVPAQPAAGADVLDAGRWRKLEQSGFELIQRRSGKKTLWAARPAFTNYEYELHETAAQAVDAIAASGRQE